MNVAVSYGFSLPTKAACGPSAQATTYYIGGGAFEKEVRFFMNVPVGPLLYVRILTAHDDTPLGLDLVKDRRVDICAHERTQKSISQIRKTREGTSDAKILKVVLDMQEVCTDKKTVQTSQRLVVCSVLTLDSTIAVKESSAS